MAVIYLSAHSPRITGDHAHLAPGSRNAVGKLPELGLYSADVWVKVLKDKKDLMFHRLDQTDTLEANCDKDQ